jgi:hypothetical protein
MSIQYAGSYKDITGSHYLFRVNCDNYYSENYLLAAGYTLKLKHKDRLLEIYKGAVIVHKLAIPSIYLGNETCNNNGGSPFQTRASSSFGSSSNKTHNNDSKPIIFETPFLNK